MKLFVTAVFIVLTSLLAVSCKKPVPDAGTVYPISVSITYRVSSSSSGNIPISITYDNETGRQTTVDNAVLPFTKTITKTVNKYSVITIGYFVNPAQTVKLEIFVNNDLVKSQEYTSPNTSMSYTFL